MKHESLDSPTVAADLAVETNPSPQEIERRARSLWEEQGRPEGRAIEHWFAAERELRDQKARRPASSKNGYDTGGGKPAGPSPEDEGRATLVAGPDARAAGEEALPAPKPSSRREPAAKSSSASSAPLVAARRKAWGGASGG